MMARITSTGSDTITHTGAIQSFSFMWVFEIAGFKNPTFETNSGLSTTWSNTSTTVSSNPITGTHGTSLLLCVASDNSANPWTSVSPSGGTTSGTTSFVGYPYFKEVGAGTYTCTFEKSSGLFRMAASSALIYTPTARTRGVLIFKQ